VGFLLRVYVVVAIGYYALRAGLEVHPIAPLPTILR
jgi:hypothetical protein